MPEILDLGLPNPLEEEIRDTFDWTFKSIEDHYPHRMDKTVKELLEIPTRPAQIELLVGGFGVPKYMVIRSITWNYDKKRKYLHKVRKKKFKFKSDRTNTCYRFLTEIKYMHDDDEGAFTDVHEFTLPSGLVQHIELYEGMFTAPGWNWSDDNRLLSDPVNQLGLLEMAEAYGTATKVERTVQQMLGEHNLKVKERDKLNIFLRSVQAVSQHADS